MTLAIDSGKVETERFELFFIKSFTTGETPLKPRWTVKPERPDQWRCDSVTAPMMNIEMWDGRMAGILLFWDECTIVRELRCGGNRREIMNSLCLECNSLIEMKSNQMWWKRRWCIGMSNCCCLNQLNSVHLRKEHLMKKR